MSYLYPISTSTEFGVVQIGSNIDVVDGVISVPQYVGTTSSVSFSGVSVSGNLSLGGKSVVTSVTPSSGPGISLTGVVTTGTSTSFTINNTGVLSLSAGVGILITTSTGNIVISASGAEVINTVGTTGTTYAATISDHYIGVTTAPCTVTLPIGITGTTYIVKNESTANNVNVKGTGETIDGATIRNLNSGASITVIFRAGQWRIV
jgi:hypothetical protein